MKQEYLDAKLERYRQKEIYPFHMPGHKRKEHALMDPYSMDITEIEGFDNLHHAEGVLLEAQKKAEKLYGSEESHFLINGSTAGSAELFANALRKMAGATLVGTQTAGKGVVMSDAQSFSDGSAAYITVGLLLDNEDQTWNEEGLRPDIDAALSVDEQNAYYDYTLDTDPQISKAVNAATALAGQN